LANLANGIWEIMEDTAEQETFTIETMEPHESYPQVPFSVIANEDPSQVYPYGQRVRPGEFMDVRPSIPVAA
jgi:hypothetical protein